MLSSPLAKFLPLRPLAPRRVLDTTAVGRIPVRAGRHRALVDCDDSRAALLLRHSGDTWRARLIAPFSPPDPPPPIRAALRGLATVCRRPAPRLSDRRQTALADLANALASATNTPWVLELATPFSPPTARSQCHEPAWADLAARAAGAVGRLARSGWVTTYDSATRVWFVMPQVVLGAPTAQSAHARAAAWARLERLLAGELA